jgi:hypothetical protein
VQLVQLALLARTVQQGQPALGRLAQQVPSDQRTPDRLAHEDQLELQVLLAPLVLVLLAPQALSALKDRLALSG